METILKYVPFVLLFVVLDFVFKKQRRDGKMNVLYLKVKNFLLITLVIFMFSSVLFATDSYALFENLTSKGAEIFLGMRDIIYVVAGFGIIGVAVSGFFGNLNWKWLGAIIIGLVVIAMTAAFINYVVYGKAGSQVAGITDTLI